VWIFRFVREIQKRREEGIARRSAQQRSRQLGAESGVVVQPANNNAGLFVRITYWALIGAFGAVAFALVKHNSRFEWSWMPGWWSV
jgi:hypothetical protein